ncbi:3-hydroxyacyl-ACP dehydratase [Dyadobacter sandarakinus]|uniref:3-hydroxyacyl-ACP dehydratase n=1 Tax=Dyadobacter sandarakinus TaxID=2747268 RepID=A0ABX7I5C9_9BACT|nr:3-hydroxyacyl-ACP dehydratase [Dyadobacter sandarakinus]QRR00928.1 3-hydroxyacyl-ACP dehydratase [Dyadobacter sandarakinus]
MFLNDLYAIIGLRSTPEKITSRIRLDAGHPVYLGHFPGAPVTPGVVQLAIVKEILEHCLAREVRLSNLRTCKFLEVLDPGRYPEITFDIQVKVAEQIQVNASASSGDVVFFKAQATYL